MTILNLREIFERFESFERRYVLGPEDISLPTELGDIKEPIEVRVRITKESEGYKVFMSISGSVELECSRCLCIFTKDISQERTKLIGRYPREESLSLREKDLEFSFIEGDTVDMKELLREEIILSVPMKPLCKPDCIGIGHGALIFGEDRKSSKDPRFAILKTLLPK
ncbi:MAG TPA: DUF177 domain-containing protein [Aquificaceae bacterium]|nr:DUF177 domain-containing protein [Aquificaceae bacterium]